MIRLRFAIGLILLASLATAQRPLELLTTGKPGYGNDGDSIQPNVSRSGRYVAFASEASNLVSGLRNNIQNIFRFDRNTGQFRQVTFGPSVASRPQQALDGRIVAFDRDQQPGVRSVEVYDFKTLSTEVVSILPPGYVEFSRQYRLHGISEDGTKVLFGVNFGETDFASALFLRDRTTQTTVQIDATGTEFGSYSPRLAARGRFVFFVRPLVGTPTTLRLQSVDLKTGLSRDETSTDRRFDQRYLELKAVSGDARYVLIKATETRYAVVDRVAKTHFVLPDGIEFTSLATSGKFAFGTDSVRRRAYRYELATGSLVRFGAVLQANADGIQNVSSSDDGQLAAFDALETDGDDLNFKRDVAIFDGTTQERVTRADLTGRAFLDAFATVSDDLRFACITTGSPNMGETVFTSRLPGPSGVYLRDRTTGETRLISVPPAGQRQNYHAIGTISGDGKRVIYAEYTDAFDVKNGTLIRYDRISQKRVPLFTFSGNSPVRGVSFDGKYLLVLTDTALGGETASGFRLYRMDTDTGNATNLFPGRTFSRNQVQGADLSADGKFAVAAVRNASFAYDLSRIDVATGLVSSPPIGGLPGETGGNVSVSSDGRYVAFGVGEGLFRWDAALNIVVPANVRFGVTVPGSEPSISPNGQRIAFRDESAALVYDFVTGGSWREAIPANEFMAPQFAGNGSLLISLRFGPTRPFQTYRLPLGTPDVAP